MGTSVALGGAPLFAALKITVPAKPLAPVTVIRQEPDWPNVAMTIVAEEHPGDTLIPDEPTLTVTELVVELPA